MIRKKFYCLSKKLCWCLKGGNVPKKERERKLVVEKDSVFFSPITKKGVVPCMFPIEYMYLFETKDYNKIWRICPSYFDRSTYF